MVGLEPAPDGTVLILGTASHRYEVSFKGPGGHSYAAFGQVPSAIHGMGRAIAKIAEIKTPSFPKTTFTVGTVGGGTSVNTIAPDARMAVDIRSDEMGALLETEKKILAAIDEAVAEENKRWNVNTLSVSNKLIGDRPGGRTPSDSVIVEAAMRSNTRLRPQDAADRRQHRRQRADVARHPGHHRRRRRQDRRLSRALRMDRPDRRLEGRADLAGDGARAWWACRASASRCWPSARRAAAEQGRRPQAATTAPARQAFHCRQHRAHIAMPISVMLSPGAISSTAAATHSQRSQAFIGTSR